MITNKGLKYCKNLNTIDLYHNTNITDEVLINMKNLEYLNLCVCIININITNNALKN